MTSLSKVKTKAYHLLHAFDYDIMTCTWKFKNLNGESMTYLK